MPCYPAHQNIFRVWKNLQCYTIPPSSLRIILNVTPHLIPPWDLIIFIFCGSPIIALGLKHNRPLWVAVQGLIRPTPYTYIALGLRRSFTSLAFLAFLQ
jgi:hypothetical protein